MSHDLAHESNPRRDFALLLALFLVMRVSALFWFSPIYNEISQFFFGFAALSDVHAYPYVDYWMEYPPVLPWLTVAVILLVAGGTGGLAEGSSLAQLAFVHLWFVRIMQLLMAASDAANLALIYLIARDTRGERFAFRAAVVYALLFYPLLVATSYLDSAVLFSILLALRLFMRGRHSMSALTLAVGTMAKVFPIVLLPVVLRHLRTWRERVIYTAVFTAVCAAIITPFLILSPSKVAASFRAASLRRPWETVWALAEGQRGYGEVAADDRSVGNRPVREWWAAIGRDTRLDAHIRSLAPIYEPDAREDCLNRIAARFSDDAGRIAPPWNRTFHSLLLLPVLGLLARIIWKSRPDPPLLLPLSLSALCLFLVYSKGWSPQFVIYPSALCLLALGPYEGPAMALALNVVNYLEMPGTWLLPAGSDALLVLAVVIRTVLLGWIAFRAARQATSR